MRLVRYNPFNELDFWNTSFNRFFNDTTGTVPKTQAWSPKVDIVEKDGQVIISAELAGMDKKDIQVNVEDRVLTISGERKVEEENRKDNYYRKERSYGSFKRAFTLSDDLITDEINADYKDGILTVTLKKDVEKETVKQIAIN